MVRIGFLSLMVFSAINAAIAQTKGDNSNLPIITPCDLIKNPDSYDKQVVRVRGNYLTGFESSEFTHPACGFNEIWIHFDSSVKDHTAPKIYKHFLRLTDTAKYEKRHSGTIVTLAVEITAIGRFEGRKPPHKRGDLILQSGYGHLNQYDFQFTILSIEDVKKITK